MIGLHRDQQALLIEATTAGLWCFFFGFFLLRFFQSTPTAAGLPWHARGESPVFAFTCKTQTWREWGTLPSSHGRARTHTHLHTLTLPVLASCSSGGISHVCQILKFQVFMKSTLSAIRESTPGWHCGIYEIHAHLSCVCVCVRAQRGVCAFVCSALTLRFLLTKLFPPKPNTLPWIYSL